ncbi:hypothetical protein PILCRDRAFT_6644 [Piloderma croceum F 1598]|jgi:hypothetical protein|uniref:Retrotransposon gag domain-containing protein n=1 Tax=Piloderma croceum (strain F 1598) TaxID=765440 RepID=A0A0C3FJ21_PILCF|nr:hypothetical protein PILCRDRAFT_6644 [Piloderma croceum F 1598]
MSSDGQDSPYVPRYEPPLGREPPGDPLSDDENPQGGPPPGGPPPPGPPPPGGTAPPPGPAPLGPLRPPPPAPPPPPNPPAPTPAAPPVGPPIDKRKSHVKKPDDFTESKQWDRFKQQTFVYVQENQKDFDTSESVICFLLSFMMEGLPEKFAANFIDDIVEDWEQRKIEACRLFQPIPSTDWGTLNSFQEKCKLTFNDQNKKSSAKHQLALLKQRTRTAEEYFQEFDQLVRTAGYQRGHNDVLIKYIHEHVRNSTQT